MRTETSERVVLIASMVPPAHSGAGYSALKYAVRLQATGKLAFLLTAAPEPPDDWDLGDAELMHVLRQQTHRVGRRGDQKLKTGLSLLMENLGRCGRTTLKLWRERRQYSIVHCFSPTWLSLFACLAAKVLRKQIVVEITLLGGDCPESVGNNRMRILHQRKMIQFRLADAIVCVSPAIKQVCRRAGFPQGKLTVIPRAVDVRKFSPVDLAAKDRLRQQLGLPRDLTLLLFVGGILVRKGIDLLLPAFEQLASRDPAIGLVLIGPGYPGGEGELWQQRIQDAQQLPELRGKLLYLGRRLNVDEFMKAADLFVLPSRKEGFPNVLVEAMASGLPPVALDLDGTTETIVADRETGYIVRSATTAALADGLSRAVADVRRDPGRIGAKAREEVMGRFSAAHVDRKYRELYRRIRAQLSTSEPSREIPAVPGEAASRVER